MKVRSCRRSLHALAMLVVFMSHSSFAIAGTSGGIAGIIIDAKTGEPIPGVHLEISSRSQAATTTTDGHGHYIVFSLQPDDYTFTLEKPGYYTRTVSGYSVYADQTQRYDVQLTPVPPGNVSSGSSASGGSAKEGHFT
jgi:hypothetical protein